MAGNFPDVPSARMALDKDGTQFYWINAALDIVQISDPNVVLMNDESVTPYSTGLNDAGRNYIAVLFPEKRDLKGYYALVSSLTDNAIQTSGATISRIEVSTNTTNGLDGTWSQIGLLSTPSPIEISPFYRSAIVSVNALGIKGVRLVVYKSWDVNVHALHLYGTITAGENTHRLQMWHPTLDQQLPGAAFDWGNVARGSSADKTFRVKNLSGSLTATAIDLGIDTLHDGTPSVPGWHLLSTNGTDFAGTASIASLTPGQVSGVCTLRRVTPTNAQLGLWNARVTAEAASWA